ncbi:MAG TPA: hypothetical protein VNK23_10045 [Candidatus Dormibacteraeota bacterium]|nr:hypothetical protein [Candidatus Dormibacteraeota bacterium]
MANPISGGYQVQQTEPINQTTKTKTIGKPVNQTAAPQDMVTLSAAGKAASQAAQQAPQTSKATTDADHDGS